MPKRIVEKPRGAWMSPGEDGEDLTWVRLFFLDAKNDSSYVTHLVENLRQGMIGKI